ncbi:unnamed protein product [Rhodiola kirilowii]
MAGGAVLARAHGKRTRRPRKTRTVQPPRLSSSGGSSSTWLNQPSPLNQDYVAHIEYEKQVEAIRFLRQKVVAWEPDKQSDEVMLVPLLDDNPQSMEAITLTKIATAGTTTCHWPADSDKA